MRKQQYHIRLTESEYQLLLKATLDYRNQVARRSGPTEDLDNLIIKLTKRRCWLFLIMQ